jgi:hypothetical protein
MKRLVAAVMGGCLLMSGVAAQAAEKVMYQEITDNKPEVGVSTTVYLGDRMLEQRHGQYQECIVPKFTAQKKMLMDRFTVKLNEPLCKMSASDKKYTPVNYDNFTKSVNDLSWRFQVNYKPQDGGFKLCAQTMCTDLMDSSKIDASPYFVYTINSVQQVIEYAGRNGDNLKFTYSEFSDGYARQAFTREFQVDLTQGKVAAYKGAIIEIESATNSSITYKVVRNFQQ